MSRCVPAGLHEGKVAGVDPWRAKEKHGAQCALEHGQRQIDIGVVAHVLYDRAGMRHRAAISAETVADLAEGHATSYVRQIHGDLAGTRDAPGTSTPAIDVGSRDDERMRCKAPGLPAEHRGVDASR